MVPPSYDIPLGKKTKENGQFLRKREQKLRNSQRSLHHGKYYIQL